jgi:hypothetical protein
VTLKKVPKNSTLFFKGPEAAILVSGKLQLLNHEEDLANPFVACTYTPGDCIGIDIDNGWHKAKHSWICAWEDCEVFLVSSVYLSYMWDLQKQFQANLVADILDKVPGFSELSEQSLFTIANEIGIIREYQSGQIIQHQCRNSMYNLQHQQKELQAIFNFTRPQPQQAAELKKIRQEFAEDCNPELKRIWLE